MRTKASPAKMRSAHAIRRRISELKQRLAAQPTQWPDDCVAKAHQEAKECGKEFADIHAISSSRAVKAWENQQRVEASELRGEINGLRWILDVTD